MPAATGATGGRMPVPGGASFQAAVDANPDDMQAPFPTGRRRVQAHGDTPAAVDQLLTLFGKEP